MSQVWNMDRSNTTNRLHDFLVNPAAWAWPTRLSLNRLAWVKLDRLQTGVGCFFSSILALWRNHKKNFSGEGMKNMKVALLYFGDHCLKDNYFGLNEGENFF